MHTCLKVWTPRKIEVDIVVVKLCRSEYQLQKTVRECDWLSRTPPLKLRVVTGMTMKNIRNSTGARLKCSICVIFHNYKLVLSALMSILGDDVAINENQ